MIEIKKSDFLEFVLDKAMNIHKKPRTMLTAERFLTALLYIIRDGEVSNKELDGAVSVLGRYRIDTVSAIAALDDQLQNGAPPTIADSMYLRRMMSEAREKAESSGMSAITADLVLSFILGDPSSSIKKIIGSAGSSSGKTTTISSSENTTPTPQNPHTPSLQPSTVPHPQAPTFAPTDTSSAEEAVAPTTPPPQPTPQPTPPPPQPSGRGGAISHDDLVAAIEARMGQVMAKKQGEQAPTPTPPPSTPAPSGESTDGSTETGESTGTPKGVKDEMASLVAEVKDIRRQLRQTVFGQDEAINVFATGYFQARILTMTDKSRRRPAATFLFAGPPGVGKTFLAEQVAQVLKLPFMRFDMSEYSDKEANIEFCGSDKVYKNAQEGNVTGFVEQNPRCVLLFDEIEKAHLVVIHLFLQMLDAGRLRDNYTDKEVSFTDAIIILTTNAGRQLYEESADGDFSDTSRKVIISALQKDINQITGAPFFPPALCSRFASGNVVMFNHMRAHNLRTIAQKEVERHAGNLENESGIKFDIDEKIYTALLFSEGGAADARTVRSRAESFFNDELYELLRYISSDKVKTEIPDIEKISFAIDLEHASADIVELFEASESAKILVYASEEAVSRCRSLASGCEIISVSCQSDVVETLKKQDVDFILLDMKTGIDEESISTVSLVNVESEARNILKFLREKKKGFPVYLLDDVSSPLSEEERSIFTQSGVRGVLTLGRDEEFASEIVSICEKLHQQASMAKLGGENKLIRFETSQSVSADGREGIVTLFDFSMAVAIESEDAKNVLSTLSRPTVRFEDVIGATDAKQELRYFIEYLKNPKKYMGTGVKAPKGVLLYGPPGTGKTMLAKAMACESSVTFIAAEGNQFLKKYVGEGAELVHQLFKTARKYAPSILFIDEIDAIAKERGSDSATSAGAAETLTAFLTEMDGFENDPSKPVFVLAATNFEVEGRGARTLDAALMRRFDRLVFIDLPSRDDRIKFLRMKLEHNPALAISDDHIEDIALRSTGMSLSELDSIVELALRSAIRGGSTKVDDAIFDEAFETFNGGEVKKWNEELLLRVARHEAGHAFLCWESGEKPTYLTIVARGDHGGYMQHADEEGKAIYTRDELLSKIRTSLGGRASEMVYYGERDGVSTGASGDLSSATRLAQQIVCTYGMDDLFGLAVVTNNNANSGEMSLEVRGAVNKLLSEQMTQAIRLITDNRYRVDALVDALMSKNHLSGKEIDAILSGAKES